MITRSSRGALAAALRVSTAVAIGLVAVFLLGIALYAAPTDAALARSTASRDLKTRALEDGERIERVLPVYRRRVWDYYRATHGVLVATDRRILFIGLPPTTRAAAAREGEPPLIEEVAYSYDDVSAAAGPVFLGRSQGIVLRTPNGRESFGVEPDGASEVDSLLATIGRQQATRRAAEERERAARDEAARKARAPICHRVVRGEALDRIAARYNTTAGAIAELNALSGSRIRAGETLLVRAGDPADAGGRRCDLPGGENLADWGFAGSSRAPEAP